MIESSLKSGQKALQPLPSRPFSDKRNLQSYPVAEALLQDRKSLKADEETGIAVFKVTKLFKLQPRRIAISLDRRNLLVTSGRIKSLKGILRTSSSARSIPLDQIDRIQRGCVTKRFLAAALEPTEMQQAFSIVFYDSGSLESLDLVILSRRKFKIVVQTLEDLAALAAVERRRLSIFDQIAHFHLTQCSFKLSESNIPYSQWMSLTDRLHIPLSKTRLTEIFRRHSDKVALSDVGLLLCQVYEELNTDTTVTRIWEEMLKDDPVKDKESISAVAFLSFLRNFQSCAHYQLDEACDLIRRLHSDQHDRLTKAQFLRYLTCDANDLVDPELAKEGAQNMHQPISRYWIHSSHSTFRTTAKPVSFGRTSSKNPADTADEQMYMAALMRGVRCLELIVWDGLEPDSVVVSSQNPANSSSSSVPLDVVLRIIANFVEHFPYSFPIILHLQICCQLHLQALADQFEAILGDFLLRPSSGMDINLSLPSPDQARGKIIIFSKRPISGSTFVVMDDFDWDIDSEKQLPVFHKDATVGAQSNKSGRLVGFDAHGPLYSADTEISSKPLVQLWKQAIIDAKGAADSLEKAQAHERELHDKALHQANLAAELMSRSGISSHQIKEKACLDRRQMSTDDQVVFQESPSMDEEGVEIHDILPHLVSGYQTRYETALFEAKEAHERVEHCKQRLGTAEKELERAIQVAQSEKGTDVDVREQTRKAVNEARMHSEDAIAAAQRVERLKELVAQIEDKAGSAGTVVQTALTEAKISEKRAFDAEARAERARVAAEHERKRAEEETRKEEIVERIVSGIHQECQLAQNTYDQVRERIEKATQRLERAKEQIRSLENSSKYREQLLLQETESRPLVVQHTEKIEERDNCLALIEKATQESIAVDKNRKQLQVKLEEKAQEWRIQAELASQTRRNADRSAHAAEELLEHAIEEREAAELRHVAYKKAESTVNDRGSQKESLFAQLKEAERAAIEAAKLAVQSKHHASALSDELEKETFSRTQQLVDEKKLQVLRLQGELDSAQLVKQHKELEVEQEKHRLNTDSELMKSTMIRDVATSTSQVNVSGEEDAINAYQSAVQLKDDANKASLYTQIVMNEANMKRDVANRASEFKALLEMTVEFSDKLSAMVFLESCRLRSWTASMRLSNVHAHSLSQRVLVKRLEENAGEVVDLKQFAKDHLCRIFPYGKKNKSFPMRAWSLGCQFVGVNLAFPDEQVLLAEGRFRENGSCGYVLKPRFLTHDDVRETEQPQRWALQVISGFNIPSSSNNVNLRVQVKVWTANGEPIVHETEEVSQNCFNPSWGNVFDLKISSPSMSIVNFIVYNGSEYLAGASLPVSCWREGFRSVALFNANHSRSGPYEFACLLVQATRHR
ncbi:hypothetical protein FisN_33Lh064 [Fistulifera solaris]|uniref:Phosphoinositide phospholipase C n=1 Tax=Fistulifera solaris TaxID=1519565 RepID=A0A1Z5KA81_FISSO|nr:hypothetical protein FisN_33Lh064 [Fistulifera solaris]|eukprot:GAX23169.1 hypothetical protein FisN_33Lh064 [Fistulifera solaris]